MKVCPSCQAQSPPDSNFCQQCGKPLAVPVDATVRLSQTQVLRGPRRQSFDVKALFGASSRLIVGRASDCDILLTHPSVSRYHARIEREGDHTLVSDLSSVNGVWVGGRRISEPTRVVEGDKIGIGPYLLTLDREGLHSLDNSRALRLEARGLERVVTLPNGATRKLLDNVNLVVCPGEFVALLGPSGSGKSTLMNALNGRRPATGGRVLANGEDFYRHYDSFRQSLGYVPQQDIVHTGLTVRRALHYTARLRLPADMAPAEMQARVDQVIRRMELGPHQDTLVGQLSGGQIKRVSLGAELLAQPSLLFIDEATSGLDAGTERRMMHLFRELADEGRSLVCITHNVDNVDQCHLALILARGKLIYYGPPGEAPKWFGVSRISDVYDRIAERDVADWERDFAKSDLYREFVADRLASPSQPAPTPASSPEERPASFLPPLSALSSKLFPPLAERFRQFGAGVLRLRETLVPILDSWNQFVVLTARYVELTLADRRSLKLLVWQAPIIALMVLLGFVGKPFNRPMPLLRELNDKEREVLLVLRGVGDLVDGKRPLTAEQKEKLRRVPVEVAGTPVKVDGTALVETLRRLQSDDLTEAQRRSLENTSLTLDTDSGPVTVQVSEVVGAWRRFQETKIPAKLLQVPGPVVPTESWYDPGFVYMLLFVQCVVVLWFGCNNAAREIVKEEAIFLRERAVGLRVTPYLASKFLVLCVMTMLQVAVLLLLVYGPLELLARTVPGHTVPPAELMLGYGTQFGVFTLLGMVGVAMGLLLSASVNTPDQANAMLPYVLIPQMVLGGGFLQITGVLYWIAGTIAPVYWAFRSVHLGADRLAPGFPGYRPDPDGWLVPCLLLATQGVVMLMLTYSAMRRKEA